MWIPAAVLALLFSAAACCADIRSAPGPTVAVQVVDASTAEPARHASVRLSSDHGVRCRRLPCATNGKAWRGLTDPQGFVALPLGVLQSSTKIDTDRLSGDVIEDSTPTNDRIWVLELLPRASAYATPPGPPRPLKLFDAVSGKAIADTPAHFEWRSAATVHPFADTRTISLGYVFLPDELPAGALENTWVIVSGFEAAHVDFAGARRRMPLPRHISHSKLSRQ